MKKTLTKEKIIVIATAMGFHLDYDQWGATGKEWMRFELNNENLDEPDLRLIWYKDDPDENNFARAANILFKAGQKKKVQSINELINL